MMKYLVYHIYMKVNVQEGIKDYLEKPARRVQIM